MIYKQGSKGSIVKQIQKAVGCLPDGVWGPLTTEALKAWQQDHGLTADGVAGAKTLAKLFSDRMATTLKLRKSSRNINEIIVHCTATKEGYVYCVDDICRWHKAQGWSTIGYHYVIYLDGSVHEGRNIDVAGAHCVGHNARSIGVCYVGGLTSDGKTAKDTRTPEQKDALLSLLLQLRALYPKATIHGHRDFARKDCPSFDATKEYRDI